jgi:cobalt-zinc-cadmium efflux system outer membrane protein
VFVRGGADYNREHREATGKPVGWEGRLEGGISVPLFNRNNAGVAAAQAEEARAESELRRLELSLRARAAGEYATYLTALRNAESYRDEILPRAEEGYRLYLARYRDAAAAYPQVLVAQRTLFDMSVRYLSNLEVGWHSALRLQGLLAGDALQSPSGTDESGDSSTMLDTGR